MKARLTKPEMAMKYKMPGIFLITVFARRLWRLGCTRMRIVTIFRRYVLVTAMNPFFVEF